MSSKFRSIALAVSLVFGVSLLAPNDARAMSNDVRAVLVAGTYGLVGGTAVGLASWPLTQDSRSIFIGSSLGLYLGLIVGIFYIGHRKDPDNPLRQERGAGESGLPNGAEFAELPSFAGQGVARKPDFKVSFRVYQF